MEDAEISSKVVLKKNQQGSLLPCVNGRLFWKKDRSKYGYKMTFKCSGYKIHKCTAKVYTDSNMENYLEPLPREEHHVIGCPKNEAKIEARQVLESTKEAARKCVDQPSKILAKALHNTPEKVQLQMPSNQAAKRALRRAKQGLRLRKSAALIKQELSVAMDSGVEPATKRLKSSDSEENNPLESNLVDLEDGAEESNGDRETAEALTDFEFVSCPSIKFDPDGEENDPFLDYQEETSDTCIPTTTAPTVTSAPKLLRLKFAQPVTTQARIPSISTTSTFTTVPKLVTLKLTKPATCIPTTSTSTVAPTQKVFLQFTKTISTPPSTPTTSTTTVGASQKVMLKLTKPALNAPGAMLPLGPELLWNQCVHCSERVPDLDNHLENEECFNAILKCSNCQRLFDCERNFLQHFSNCSLNKITCEFCDVEFYSNLLFAYHWYHVHADLVPSGLDKCKFCHNGWCQLLVGTGRPKCMICSSFYTSRSSLLKHVHASHLKADHQISRIIKKRLTCSFCYANFGSTVEMRDHFLELKCKFVKCDQCGCVFKDKDKFYYHRTMCHKPGGIKIVPDENHQCPKCGLSLYEKNKIASTKFLSVDQFVVN